MTATTLHRQIERARFARHATVAAGGWAGAAWAAVSRAYLGLQRAHTAHAWRHVGDRAGREPVQSERASPR